MVWAKAYQAFLLPPFQKSLLSCLRTHTHLLPITEPKAASSLRRGRESIESCTEVRNSLHAVRNGSFLRFLRHLEQLRGDFSFLVLPWKSSSLLRSLLSFKQPLCFIDWTFPQQLHLTEYKRIAHSIFYSGKQMLYQCPVFSLSFGNYCTWNLFLSRSVSQPLNPPTSKAFSAGAIQHPFSLKRSSYLFL